MNYVKCPLAELAVWPGWGPGFVLYSCVCWYQLHLFLVHFNGDVIVVVIVGLGVVVVVIVVK